MLAYHYYCNDLKKYIEQWPRTEATSAQKTRWPNGINLQMLGNNQAHKLILLPEDGFDARAVFSVTQSTINKILNPDITHPIFPKIADIIRLGLFLGLPWERTVHLIGKIHLERNLVKQLKTQTQRLSSYFDIGAFWEQLKNTDIPEKLVDDIFFQMQTLDTDYNKVSRNNILAALKDFFQSGTISLSNHTLVRSTPPVGENLPTKTKPPLVFSKTLLVLTLAFAVCIPLMLWLKKPEVVRPVYSRAETRENVFTAVKKNDLDLVEHWIQHGVTPNLADNSGWTLLMEAADRGSLPMVAYLLQQGANPGQCRKDGWTALMCAVYNNHIEIVQLLRKSGTDLNQPTRDGWTALMTAANNGHLAILEYLVREGAKVNATRRDGWSALHAAVNNGHDEIVRALLDHKANPNLATTEGWTPLMAAARNNDQKIVSRLLAAGASKSTQNRYHETAADVARNAGAEYRLFDTPLP